MPTPDPNFPYLGPNLSPAKVEEMLGESDTIWSGDCAGRLFEVQENAQIKGCSPGNFRGIDSLEDVVIKGKTYKAAVSLKTIDTEAPGFTTKAGSNAWKYFETICWNHLRSLSQFRREVGNLRQLADHAVKQVKVDVDEDGVQLLLLRVGVRSSTYLSLKKDFDKIEKNLTCTALGGISPDCTAKTSSREIPLATQIKALPDNCFLQDQGRSFETVKDASIAGLPPARFLTIDKHVPAKNRVISYKAHDIVNGYQGPSGPQSLYGVLVKEINELAAFTAHTEPEGARRTIGLGHYDNKRLSIGIPTIPNDVLQARWHPTFETARQYAAGKGVIFRVHRVA